MNKIFLLFVCCITSLVASAVVTTYPSSISVPYGGATQTICQNKPNVSTTVFYSVCGTSTAGAALVATPTWYLGGVAVYTGAPITISAAGGNITLPAAAFTYTATGTFTGPTGLYCQLDWSGASPCGGVTSVLSSTTTINVVASPTPVTGTASVCTGLTTTLNSTPAGGVWTSGNALVAGIAFGTGVVTGNAAGTANITYTIGSGCFVSATVTVNQTPAVITGANNVCTNALNNMHDATLGGVWSSSNTTAATIGSATGTMTDIAPGVTTISYTVATGCLSTIDVTVNQAPAVITGTAELCVGTQTTLTDATTGGDWTSSSPGIASVIFNTGVVTGVTAGTAHITYTMSSGCNTTQIVTVDPLPTPILGSLSVCVNALTILTDATAGGFWAASNANVSVGTGSGFAATGVTAGLDTVYYTLSPSGCFRSAVITINPLPAAISGVLSVCAGGTTALTDASTGGTWTSGTTTVATIVSSTGVATGVSAGTSNITYKLGTGCLTTLPITVNPLPAAITGSAYVCVGLTTNLSDVSAGGVWSSGNLSVATIGSGTGDVTGVSPGTAMITYTLGTGCAKTFLVTVNPVPAVISGASSVCVGSTITLTDATTGGVWTSSTPAAATISSTGLVIGVATGTTTITYKITPTGCYSTYLVSVNPIPNNITGVPRVCAGLVTALSDVTGGGTWSSTNTAVATVDASGNVSGVSAGTSVISYYLGTGCTTSVVATVNPLPSAISGLGSVCTGSTITLSDVPAGGTWTSLSTGIATITATGVVTGVAAGTDVINYTLSTGCMVSTTITVNPLPLVITGTTNVCVGATTSLTDGTPGGSWTSSIPARATVDATGLVTGVASGTTTITYALGTGCFKTITVTVNPLPASVSGTMFVCEGSTTSLGDASLSGTWTSSTPSVATISGTGVVTGVAAGTSTISYTLPTSCASSAVVTVNPLPAAITGAQTVCIGLTTNLTDATPGGLWSSSYTPVATVGFSTGVVTGIAAGVANITYTLGTNCKAWATVTVNSLPAGISGPVSVCIGSTITLTDASTGGSWTSADGTIATIGSGTGIVIGVSAGTVMMTYTLASGCIRTININVNPLPTTVLGAGNVCVGQTVTLTDATLGGTWTSGNTVVATAGAGTGVITGVSAGTAKITYTLSSGCFTTSDMVVNPTPPLITGVANVCIGQTTTLSDGLFVGTWSSANPVVATIDGGGVVTGVAAGTATISYIAAVGGCFRTTAVTVKPLPSPITGATSVCTGSTAAVADATSGGAWSSSTPAIATISGGTITPVAPGTTTITYTLSTGCYITSTVTVNPSPLVITGTNNVCVGFTVNLSDLTPAGTWTSSNAAIASVDLTLGVVTGNSAGSATITYTVATGCKQTFGFTVFALPAPITGVNFVCEALTTTLHDATAGGTWSSDNTAVATITSTGVVTGVTVGTADISYVTAAGCPTSIVVSVNPFPSPISGTLSVCTGATTPLSDAATGGQWTSSATTKATVGLLTGVVTGVNTGTATITYTMGTGCIATAQVTINPTPPAIAGANSLCEGTNTLLTDALAGGSWTSSDFTIATVGIGTGNVVALDIPGSVTISYTVGACSATRVITVNQAPTAIYNAVDSGVFSLCTGVTTTLADTVTGGTWNSSNTAVATIGVSTGVLSGVSAGTANITYSLGSGCQVSTTVTVNTNPGPIMGAGNVCPNATINLSDAIGSGTWAVDYDTVATVSVTTGVVTGISAGVATITYSLGVGCSVTATVNVNPAPSAILGTLGLCAGTNTTLSDTTAGGIWTSSQPAAVPIGISSGVVSGIIPDTAVITYKLLTSGCFTTAIVTVNPNPAAITGVANTCVGQSTSLSDAVLFGSWSSDNSAIASVGISTGIVTGVDSGTTIITYTLPTGCFTTTLFRVNLATQPVTGLNTVCEGAIITLSDATPFGTWSSSNTAVATANPVSGEITGVSAGTTTISYTLGTGCYATYDMTVTPLPAPILGPLYVCLGSNIFLSDVTVGGTWTSSATTVVTVDPFGDVTGMSIGISNVSYTLPTGCYRSVLITVNDTPSSIIGNTTLCVALVDTLTSTPLGGTWTSSNTAVADADPLGGYITGVSPGVAIISYTSLAGCSVRTMVTVFAAPKAITGIDSICPGLSTDLFDSTGGGAWSSSDPGVASITASGTLTAIVPGTAIISYTFLAPPGCAAILHFKVEPLPYVGSITGIKTVCQADSTSLGDSVAGGVWSSADNLLATVGSSSGVVMGVGPGTTTISYIVTQQCGMDTATTTVTINPLPFAGPILGFTQICAHYSTTLSDTTLGGIWTSANPGIATVDSASGLVTGIAGGSVMISYTTTNSCGSYTSTQLVTVNEAFGFGHIVTFPDTPLCANSLFRNFGVESPAPSGIIYTWSASNAQIFDTSSNGQYALVSFHNPGLAVVRMSSVILSSGCAITDSFVTTIGTDTAVNTRVQYYLSEFVCTDNTADNYQWGYDNIASLDSTIIHGQTSQAYFNPTPDTLGKNYWVMTNKGGCWQKTYYRYSSVTAVSNVNTEYDVNLFPNPAEASVNIVVNGANAYDAVEVKITDMLGKDLKTVMLKGGKGSFDVSELSSGVYSVLISRDGVRIATKKFVKN